MYAIIKRFFDFTAALLGLLILAPALIVIAVAIKLDSRGPIFYLGRRVGRHGKTFNILKFRTMCVNAESMGTTTSHGDLRITMMGRFLRKYKLDEFPQLINVLKGEMSIVGPRPEVEEHTNAYDEEEKAILTVLPGITDYSSIRFVNLGEVLGSENAHQVFVTKIRKEKNQLRLMYVRNRSLWEDLRIVSLTAVTLIRVAVGRAGGKDCST